MSTHISNSSCCETDHKIHTGEHDHHDDHDHGNPFVFKTYLPATIGLVLLLSGIAMDYYLHLEWFKNETLRFLWYLVAYIPVAFPVFREAYEALKKGSFFNEFTLMGIATLGAFALKEYPEGVAVMLFYTIGELFQSAAVNKAKGNIKALLDARPESVDVFRNGSYTAVEAEEVKIGEKIQLKVGDKLALDGIMLSDSASVNTAALTGESKPRTVKKGESILAGMILLDKVIEVEVSKIFKDSALSRILEMVEEATTRKAKTELFIRKFAKVYTPIVFFLALALVILPYFFVSDYNLNDWVYRALVFLVISCPCALVISIPLGYFGGIGAASRNGILFKGSNYLDLLAKVNIVVMDKTGTLTEGVFEVQKVYAEGVQEEEMLSLLSALEEKSTHPIAQAIVAYQKSTYKATNVREISGHGVKGTVNGKEVLAGNAKLLQSYAIVYDSSVDDIVESIVLTAIDGKYAGYVIVADQIKEDAYEALEKLRKENIRSIMLSGDKDSIVQEVARTLNITEAYGNLLPENKVAYLENYKKEKKNIVAFVGDGINDAPVLALSDVGIAMGAMGSDVAIETADVVIQTDQISKIPVAINIGRETKKIVIQNISLAFGVKLIVLILGAGGLANMWEAVFADVGVALLAILNAVRIQRMKF